LWKFVEVESGKRSDRTQLAAAMALAKKRAATLLVARLDRLSRSVAFISALMDSRGFDLAIADMPGELADASCARRLRQA
jgi:DNA invertase Pin-like site-specific DNA recombinase